jgi:hypothetical protein
MADRTLWPPNALGVTTTDRIDSVVSRNARPEQLGRSATRGVTRSDAMQTVICSILLGARLAPVHIRPR